MNKLLNLFFLLLGISVLPQKINNIKGDYNGIEQNDCNKKNYINIFFAKKKLFYIINIGKKQQGKIHMTKDENLSYLHFGKIEGVYKNDTIIFQNYGNSLNNYQKFKECSAKYLYFVKYKKETNVHF